MTTSTIEKPQTVRFAVGGAEGFTQVVEPQQARYDGYGKTVPVPGTGKRIEFKPDGNNAQFYETSDPDEIKFLRERIADPVRPASYFEVPPIAPPTAPTLAEISLLAAKRDVDGLAKLYREESENWAREDVLQQITLVSDALGPEK